MTKKYFYVFLKKVLNEWKYMYKMYHVEEQYLTAWYYIPLTGFNRYTFFFITGSSSEAHHDSFCFVQTWSKDICGCKCESSAVNDCIQMELGIDVDCQCVDVKAFRRHKAGKHVSLKWVYLQFDANTMHWHLVNRWSPRRGSSLGKVLLHPEV